MENMAEALKIAFAVLMFVIALTLSISSFSQAKIAVDAITTIRDRRTEYIEDGTNRDIYNAYITPSEDLTRTVGIETVVSSMYNLLVLDEETEIYFFDESGDAIDLYYSIDNDLQLHRDALGPIATNCISLKEEEFGGDYGLFKDIHIDLVLGGENVLETIIEENIDDERIIGNGIDIYRQSLIHPEGLYEYFNNMQFKESFGEYYLGEDSKQKMKVITYTVVP